MNLIPIKPCSQGYKLVQDLRAINQIPQLYCVDELFVPGEKARFRTTALEKLMEDCLLWEGSHSGAVEDSEESSC